MTNMRLKMLVLSLLVAFVVAATAFAGAPGFPYVFKRGSGSIIRVNGSLESYKRIEGRWSGEFIWLRHGGRDYLIRDASVLAAAAGAFAEMDAMEPQRRAAEERLRPIEKKYDALEERAERFEDDPAHDAERREAERALEAMEPEYQAAENAVERIDEEMERREKIAERKFEDIVLRAVDAGKAQRVD
jgi:hypothetical protein